MIKKIIIILIILFINNIEAFARITPKMQSQEEKVIAANITFFENFKDEYLNNYIYKALQNNHDTRSKAYKSEQFRNQIKYQFGQELPSLSVQANYLGVKVPLLDNFRLKRNAFILPFSLNWELDFLKKNSDKTKSAKKLYKSKKLEEKSACISLVADVATAYINILKFDKTIELQSALIKNRYQYLNRVQKKFKYGTIDKTSLNNEITELHDLEIELANLEKNRKFLENSLCVLIGEMPECECKRSRFEDFANNFKPIECISQDAIFNRPDVMSALMELQSAGLDVRVAKKDFLPSFNITGLYIFNTIGPGNFFSWRATLASIIAGATQDIFSGGKKIANLKMKKARYDELFENYMQTSLDAVREVNDTLFKKREDSKILEATAKKYSVEKQNRQLENRRYKYGVSGFLDLIEAESSFIEINQDLVSAKTQDMINIVSLYKAAGGEL